MQSLSISISIGAKQAMPVAVIVGVGPSAGLGATLCRHAAQAGLHVFAGGRTLALLEKTQREIERLEEIVRLWWQTSQQKSRCRL